jgi:hypothetical protein
MLVMGRVGLVLSQFFQVNNGIGLKRATPAKFLQIY